MKKACKSVTNLNDPLLRRSILSAGVQQLPFIAINSFACRTRCRIQFRGHVERRSERRRPQSSWYGRCARLAGRADHVLRIERRRSAVCPVRYSWLISRVTLMRTIAAMTKKLAAAPVKAERTLAVRRIMTRGFLNLARNCRISAFLRSPWIRLGPNRVRRRAASALRNPSGFAAICSKSAVMGSFQKGSAVYRRVQA
jgi:hypothetical protein